MSWRTLTFRVVVAVLVVSQHAKAQEARLNFVQARTNHSLLGTLRGGSIELSVPLVPRIGLRLGYEVQRHEYHDLASTCSGLIPPNVDCGPEPSDERAAMDEITLGVPVTLVTLHRMALEVTPALSLTSVEHTRRGLDSGGRLSADKSMWAAEVGVAVIVAPVSSWPIRVHVGWQRAVLRPMEQELVVDGYTPFEGSIGTTRWEVGASVDLKDVF